MTDVLVRGVPEDDIARVDAEAARLGLSRNAYLQREIHRIARHRTVRDATPEDFARVKPALKNLTDDDTMTKAWA